MTRRPPPGQAPRRTGPEDEGVPTQRLPTPPPRPPTRTSAPARTPAPAPARTPAPTRTSARTSTPVRRSPPPRATNDRLPLIVGGVVGLILLALIAVVIVTSNNNNSAVQPVATVAAGVPPAAGVVATAAPAGQPPPRMSLETFKALYDDPAKRPIIIDVRAAASYDEGHIAGAISFPEADVDARIAELPKDKLVIAYCQ